MGTVEDADGSGVWGPWPLTGRAREVEALVRAIEGECRAVFLLGEAGCGKTRLARETIESLGARAWTTATALATESVRRAPLGALAHLIPTGRRDDPLGAVHAARAALSAGDVGGRVVLHVDDVHHLDTSSAQLLVGLAEADVVRLVLTARVGTSLPDALVALRSSAEARSVVIGPLDRPDADELLTRVLGGPLDGVAASQLFALTQGNPLYLRELVIGGVADGSLRETGGVWQLHGRLPATEGLSERVLGRLETLSADAREALELVALGEPLGLDLLESMTSLEALEELEQLGHIRIETSRRRHEARLAHPMYGEALRASLGRVRVRTRSRALAEAVSALGARRSVDSGRLVRWQIDAGLTPDAERALRSAEVARHHNDWIGAAWLARVAYDAGLADAANLLAEAHYALGEFEEGDLIAEPALAQPGRLSDAALTSLHRTRAGVWFFGSRDPADAMASVAEAAELVTDADLRDMLAYAQAAMCMWSGRVEQARALAEPLLEAPDPKVRVQAAIAVETVAATAGPATTAIEMGDHWYAVHSALPDLNGTNSPAFHLLIKTEALVNAGRFVEGEQLATMGYELSVGSLNRIAQMWFARELGRIAMYRGDAAGSRRWLLEQTALCRGTAWLRPLALGLSELAVAEAHLGDAAAAAAALAERDGLGVPVIELFASEGVRGTAWERAARGEPEEARRLLVAAAAAAETAGIVLLGALARVDALRLGDADQARPLAEAAAVVGSDTVAVAARWAAAGDDVEELGAVSEAFEQMGCLLHAAEVGDVEARVWGERGDTRQATAAQRRADALRARCGGRGAPMPPSVEEAIPTPLTPREREIAAMVAEGLTSKQVAEQLFVSPRTVSNHLQNAYAKLGISRRAELAEALAQLTLQADDV